MIYEGRKVFYTLQTSSPNTSSSLHDKYRRLHLSITDSFSVSLHPDQSNIISLCINWENKTEHPKETEIDKGRICKRWWKRLKKKKGWIFLTTTKSCDSFLWPSLFYMNHKNDHGAADRGHIVQGHLRCRVSAANHYWYPNTAALITSCTFLL